MTTVVACAPIVVLLGAVSLLADMTYEEVVRQLRWPEGVRCPHCPAAQATQPGRDTLQPARQK